MIKEGLICVPESRVIQTIKEYHEQLNHIGAAKMLSELNRRFLFPPTIRLMDELIRIRNICITCQACDPPNWNLNMPLDFTPVPQHIMSSVCLDVLSLPEVEWKGQKYDQILVCVDRLSGWIIARPCVKGKLTAENAAHLMLENG